MPGSLFASGDQKAVSAAVRAAFPRNFVVVEDYRDHTGEKCISVNVTGFAGVKINCLPDDRIPTFREAGMNYPESGRWLFIDRRRFRIWFLTIRILKHRIYYKITRK